MAKGKKSRAQRTMFAIHKGTMSENRRFAEEFTAAMERLCASGYGSTSADREEDAPVVREDDPPPRRHR
jgi:hypothetical protein